MGLSWSSAPNVIRVSGGSASHLRWYGPCGSIALRHLHGHRWKPRHDILAVSGGNMGQHGLVNTDPPTVVGPHTHTDMALAASLVGCHHGPSGKQATRHQPNPRHLHFFCSTSFWLAHLETESHYVVQAVPKPDARPVYATPSTGDLSVFPEICST